MIYANSCRHCLIEDDNVALIERRRAGLHYYVFPGGGADDGETLEQSATREAMEELGIEVIVRQKVAEVHFGQSLQIYFLVEQLGGEFGAGTGEEFTDSDPNNPQEGIYIPSWMPIEELPRRDNVHPADLARLVVRSKQAEEPVVVFEEPK